MRKKSSFSSSIRLRSKLFLVIIAISIFAVNCGKDKNDHQDAPLPPENPTDIQKPAKYNDPAILPPSTTLIEKYEGEFTPLLTDIIANWRIASAVRYQHSIWKDCWSEPMTITNYYGVTRSNIKGTSITYPKCGSHPDNITSALSWNLSRQSLPD